MRRIMLVAVLALSGLSATAGTAGADIGDIRELSVDENIFGTASEVDLTGRIDCQTTVEYGLWAGVAQHPPGDEAGDETFIHFDQSDRTATDAEAPVEGVGAYGPNFDPPVGISDDSPCSQATQSWDLIVQQNRDSADFETGDGDNNLTLAVIAGSSAEDGDRGPGPFIGDMLGVTTEDVDFERTR